MPGGSERTSVPVDGALAGRAAEGEDHVAGLVVVGSRKRAFDRRERAQESVRVHDGELVARTGLVRLLLPVGRHEDGLDHPVERGEVRLDRAVGAVRLHAGDLGYETPGRGLREPVGGVDARPRIEPDGAAVAEAGGNTQALVVQRQDPLVDDERARDRVVVRLVDDQVAAAPHDDLGLIRDHAEVLDHQGAFYDLPLAPSEGRPRDLGDGRVDGQGGTVLYPDRSLVREVPSAEGGGGHPGSRLDDRGAGPVREERRRARDQVRTHRAADRDRPVVVEVRVEVAAGARPDRPRGPGEGPVVAEVTAQGLVAGAGDLGGGRAGHGKGSDPGQGATGPVETLHDRDLTVAGERAARQAQLRQGRLPRDADRPAEDLETARTLEGVDDRCARVVLCGHALGDARGVVAARHLACAPVVRVAPEGAAAAEDCRASGEGIGRREKDTSARTVIVHIHGALDRRDRPGEGCRREHLEAVVGAGFEGIGELGGKCAAEPGGARGTHATVGARSRPCDSDFQPSVARIEVLGHRELGSGTEAECPVVGELAGHGEVPSSGQRERPSVRGQTVERVVAGPVLEACSQPQQRDVRRVGGQQVRGVELQGGAAGHGPGAAVEVGAPEAVEPHVDPEGSARDGDGAVVDERGSLVAEDCLTRAGLGDRRPGPVREPRQILAH